MSQLNVAHVYGMFRYQVLPKREHPYFAYCPEAYFVLKCYHNYWWNYEWKVEKIKTH